MNENDNENDLRRGALVKSNIHLQPLGYGTGLLPAIPHNKLDTKSLSVSPGALPRGKPNPETSEPQARTAPEAAKS